jgi:hypothetical protein
MNPCYVSLAFSLTYHGSGTVSSLHRPIYVCWTVGYKPTISKPLTNRWSTNYHPLADVMFGPLQSRKYTIIGQLGALDLCHSIPVATQHPFCHETPFFILCSTRHEYPNHHRPSAEQPFKKWRKTAPK